MKTALQRVEDHISAMKNHIGQCMDMMGNLMGGNKMQDGMMGTGMKSGGMMNPDSAQASQMPNKGNKVDHEKHHSK